MLLYLFIAVNAFMFLVVGYDKSAAKNNRFRVSERFILLGALLFGALGTYSGMRLFRHKTRKPLFKFGVPLLILLQLLAVVMLQSR